MPSSHVHAITVNPKDGQVYLATHDGLFIAGADGWTARGPNIDLMGFTVADSDHFYASGHPGEGTDLPSPVGLIESRDGGTTWTSLSRGGESDFHTLTTSSGGIAGFDGKLRISPDGTEWGTGTGLQGAAFSLAGGESGAVLATTELGLSVSIDDGATWAMADDAPLMLLVAWADGETVAGIEPDGTIHVSIDGGRTWQKRGRVEGQPEALGATGSGDALRILAVADGSVSESRDAGATFDELQP
ncbi:exo-alpha-sialidase [Pengzhenrongella frigida]|uniref:Exo-alpha-sialidase n=1 Tax=Pengzhenrongella frigida TaxID=1259133 RepID=A0A4Q5MVD3_9MICO|nr:exo-alpha-sialidase [Cellulomonas sp. HLT2-17]